MSSFRMGKSRSRTAVAAGWAAVVLLTATGAHASFVTNWSGSQMLTDNDPSGWSFSFTPAETNATITDVNVTLDIAGGFNGDLYAYLVHGGSYSVLLNRTGRTDGAPDGYANTGFAVTLDDQAPLVGGTTFADIHLYGSLNPVYNGSGQLTSTWQPDGRTDSPTNVLAGTSNRTAFLSSFNGQDPAGSWTLFVADLSPGGVSTMRGASIEVSTIPEPASLVMLLAGLALCGLRRLRPRTVETPPAG